MIRYLTRALYSAHFSGAVLLLAVLLVIKLTVSEQRDDGHEISPSPEIGEVAENTRATDRQKNPSPM